jgi:hypothetical protein
MLFSTDNGATWRRARGFDHFDSFTYGIVQNGNQFLAWHRSSGVKSAVGSMIIGLPPVVT